MYEYIVIYIVHCRIHIINLYLFFSTMITLLRRLHHHLADRVAPLEIFLLLPFCYACRIQRTLPRVQCDVSDPV